MTTDIDNNTRTTKSGRVSAATERMRERATAAKARASDAYSNARTRASEAYGTAYSTARDRASQARHRTSDEIDTNPMAAIFGGLAVGALLAAILPRTRREDELFGKYGRQLNDRAREAAQTARDAGAGRLDEMGFTKEAAKQKLNELASGAGQAARTSAGAVAQSFRKNPSR